MLDIHGLLCVDGCLLDVPEEPVARLWHAATLLREHRGDGHNAALLAHADIMPGGAQGSATVGQLAPTGPAP
ncbi:hypothetical protein KDL01_13395 [Actinospica durhamensis]|uniref:Uncharacterized protein n=1 Tax=Actinospica durhamensis TaxID=1508375 RepID=A0A941ESF4_9ACTN|nr:hypothetical protein [Actinospica durhamensis]MBR7834264.1 hypothetical protein [Actinospica durhamensis]